MFAAVTVPPVIVMVPLFSALSPMKALLIVVLLCNSIKLSGSVVAAPYPLPIVVRVISATLICPPLFASNAALVPVTVPPFIVMVPLFSAPRPVTALLIVVFPCNSIKLLGSVEAAPYPLPSIVVSITSVTSIYPPFFANNAALFPVTVPSVIMMTPLFSV